MLRNGTCILLYLKCQNTPPAERHLYIIQKPANWSLQLRKHEKSYENIRMIPVILRNLVFILLYFKVPEDTTQSETSQN